MTTRFVFPARRTSALRPALALAGATLGLACTSGLALAEDDRPSRSTVPAPQLAPVWVTGLALDDATTEGTGSYASPKATIGGKSAVSVLEIPNSVSIVTRQRIEDQNLRSAEEALAQVTGVTVTPWDGATSQIRSRGYFLEPSYDGLPAFGNLNATQQFDLAMFDRVEVLRGPAGLFQGSGQPGGTANFVRKRAPAEFRGSAAASYGSWANKRGELDLGMPLNAQGTLRGRLVATAQERDFHYAEASSRKKFVYGTVEYDFAPATTLSLYGAFQDDQTSPFMGLPAYSDGRLIDAPRSTNPMTSWSRYGTRNSTLAAEVEHRLNNGWRVKLHASHAERDWRLNDGSPNSGVDPLTGRVAGYGRRGWDDSSARHAADLYATGPFPLLGRRHEATLGYNYERYRGDTLYGANSTIPNVPFDRPDLVPAHDIQPYVRGSGYETRQSGFYGQLRLSVAEPLTVVLGGRLSDYTTRSRTVAPSPVTGWADGTRERGTFTPYAGLVYRLSERFSVYTSYSNIFMPQSQKDRGGRALDPREGKQI